MTAASLLARDRHRSVELSVVAGGADDWARTTGNAWSGADGSRPGTADTESGHGPRPAAATRVTANAAQFALLALVNLFVGGMVGLERTVTRWWARSSSPSPS
jgi:hypothetical protein